MTAWSVRKLRDVDGLVHVMEITDTRRVWIEGHGGYDPEIETFPALETARYVGAGALVSCLVCVAKLAKLPHETG